MVGRGTGSNGAGIDVVRIVLHYRQTAPGEREPLCRKLVLINYQEEVAAQLARLFGSAGSGGHGPIEPMGRATSLRGMGAGL